MTDPTTEARALIARLRGHQYGDKTLRLLMEGAADALEAALARETALERLRVHCPNCGADYAETGIEAGCPCRIVAERDALRERVQALEVAANALLAFVRGRFPDDFKPGGKGYVCEHHKRLAGLLPAQETDL